MVHEIKTTPVVAKQYWDKGCWRKSFFSQFISCLLRRNKILPFFIGRFNSWEFSGVTFCSPWLPIRPCITKGRALATCQGLCHSLLLMLPCYFLLEKVKVTLIISGNQAHVCSMSHSANTCQMPVGVKLHAPCSIPWRTWRSKPFLPSKNYLYSDPVGSILWKMRILFKSEKISWTSAWLYSSSMIQ